MGRTPQTLWLHGGQDIMESVWSPWWAEHVKSDFACVHGLHGGQEPTESIGYMVDRTSWSLYGLHSGQDTWRQILHESMGFMVGRTP